VKKADFCKRCAIHIGKSQFNRFACTICKRLKGKYYPSKFIKARKPEGSENHAD